MIDSGDEEVMTENGNIGEGGGIDEAAVAGDAVVFDQKSWFRSARIDSRLCGD